MDNVIIFKEQFRQALNKKIEHYEVESRRLFEIGDEDASVLEKIRKNIAEIYLRMFDKSWDEKFIALNPALKKIGFEATTYLERADRTFRYFLEIIPCNWRVELDEARRHEDYEAEIKTLAKIEVRDEIEKIYHFMRSNAQEDQS